MLYLLKVLINGFLFGKKRRESSVMEKEKTKFKILVFPWLAISHVAPYLELSKRLSVRNFHIYFCSSAINLDLIKSNLSGDDDAFIDLVQLNVPSLPDLPPNFHTTKNLPPNLQPTLIKALQMSVSPLSEILDALQPDLLIYDFFQPWAAKQALSRGISSVYFATSGAAPFSFYHHQFTYRVTSTYPFPEIYLLEHEQVDIHTPPPEPVVIGGDDDEFSFGDFKLSSEIVLVRSSIGFEGKYIEYLSELCQKKVIPTGLLIRGENGAGNDSGDEKCEQILEWLDKKIDLSTVFICFGSDHFLSEDQVMEIGKGLDMCAEINFVWVIKFDDRGKISTLEDALPEGFLDRVKERGLILQGWAPQTKILQHGSIGGFISHCGWSSVLESLYFGVPIIGLPIRYDQPINARLVANAGAGVEIEKDGNGKFLSEEVAKVIREVFVGESGEAMRHAAKNLGDRLKEEAEEAMEEVAKELLSLCEKNKK